MTVSTQFLSSMESKGVLRHVCERMMGGLRKMAVESISETPATPEVQTTPASILPSAYSGEVKVQIHEDC